MHVTRSRSGFRAVAWVVAAGIAAASATSPYAPHIQPAEFVTGVDHPWFPLVPGTSYRYLETAGAKADTDEVTVTGGTRTVMGVRCVVVHDVVRAQGVVLEETFDWYAQDRRGNVWYFGEDSRERTPGGGTSTAGSWEAGFHGARPGIVMRASPAPGAPYRQEYDPGRAEDMAQVESVTDTVRIPFGTWTHCVRTREWSPLERGTERKWYARGIGFVRSTSSSGETSLLVAMRRP